MSILVAQEILQKTYQAQKYLPPRDPALYGAAADPQQHQAGFADYAIGNCQEPVLDISFQLPSCTRVVATARGDAAIVTKALAHVDVDDDLLPPDYRELPQHDLAELFFDRTAAAWDSHFGWSPDWISIYRTYADWRILLPWHAEAHLASLIVPGCDPRYVYATLRQQGLHRIRILPKRWRTDETAVADRVLFRGSDPTGDAARVLELHDSICDKVCGAAVCF
jgi:hypothetical protein